MSKNKTHTISVCTLVKKVIIKFLLFNDLPSYIRTLLYDCNSGKRFKNCTISLYFIEN